MLPVMMIYPFSLRPMLVRKKLLQTCAILEAELHADISDLPEESLSALPVTF